MNDLTLRELCRECGVSRRAVQGFEKQGLVKATGRTDRGYLLYDREAQKTISWIKSMQNFGFTVKEITGYQRAAVSEKRILLKEKLDALENRRIRIERYIAELRDMLERMEDSDL